MSTSEKNYNKLEEKPTRIKLEFGSKIVTSKKDLEEKVYNKYFPSQGFKNSERGKFVGGFRNWVVRFSTIIEQQIGDCKLGSKSKSYLNKIKKGCDGVLKKFVSFNGLENNGEKISTILSAIELVKKPIDEVHGEIIKNTFPSSSRLSDSTVKGKLGGISMMFTAMETQLRTRAGAKK